MFGFNDTERQQKIAMMQGIRITSKEAAKIQSLMITGGDIKQAQDMYKFLVDGMENLPDHDPAPQTWQDSTKNTVNGAMGWLKDNQGTIITFVDYVRSLFGRGSVQAAATVAEETAEELPEIN